MLSQRIMVPHSLDVLLIESKYYTYCIGDECYMLPSFYAYYNLYNIKYGFHRNTGFKPPSNNTSAIKSYIYMCVRLIFPLSTYMCPSDLPLLYIYVSV